MSSQLIGEFFFKNQLLLEKFYPGINHRYLISEITPLIPTDHPLIEIENIFEQLIQGVPLAYIKGQAHFYGYDFFIEKGVFIPRFETEILVELALKNLQEIKKNIQFQNDTLKIADIGVGSGCILLTMLMEWKEACIGHGYDLSALALQTTQKNADLFKDHFHSQTQIHLFNDDRMLNLKNLHEHEQYHMIISNPPYIKYHQDRPTVHEQVIQYEPHLALFINDDEYAEWFKLLFQQVHHHLLPEGIFLMEGHEDHWDLLKSLMSDVGEFEEIECLKDLTGRWRFLKACKKYSRKKRD